MPAEPGPYAQIQLHGAVHTFETAASNVQCRWFLQAVSSPVGFEATAVTGQHHCCSQSRLWRIDLHPLTSSCFVGANKPAMQWNSAARRTVLTQLTPDTFPASAQVAVRPRPYPYNWRSILEYLKSYVFCYNYHHTNTSRLGICILGLHNALRHHMLRS